MRKYWISLFLGAYLGSLPILADAASSWKQQVAGLVQNGSVLVVDEKGQILFSHQADRPFVPASTLKVATALAALSILGPEFRFPTEFFTDGAGNLYVKGYGDPFLISEEFSAIARALKDKGLKSVQDIILDNSYYDPEAQIPGLAGSLNPYDAYNGALLANFNTIYIIKSKNGGIQSAEPQTPVTEITKTLAKRAPLGKSRINVAVHKKEAPLYVGFLLKEFLARQGVPVKGGIRMGLAPSGTQAFLSYKSSKNLREVLRAGLKYSQNLIMNQIFFTLGVAKLGPPATVEKGKKIFEEFLRSQLGLKNIQVEEGSGISRNNLITALEMDKILVQFFPYHSLLPEQKGMWVKTGTLKGVSSLVGYFPSARHGWVRFVILLNQAAGNRDKIAQILKQHL